MTKRILPDKSPLTNATNFDSYFYIKTSSIIDTLPRPCIPPISSPIYSFSTFSLPTIININNLLLTVKSTCKLDPIPLCLLHSLSSLLSPFYKKIIDRSLTAGIFPSHMKYAHVIPIPKNQSIDRSTLSNYRPISNLSFISKTIERIIAKQLRTYINNNNILHKLQSAYTTEKSTETSLLHTLNNILLFPKNTPTILILLDLSSAFDTLDHNILIRRLENIGIKDSVLSWFTSYLINRSFSICIDNAITEPRHTTHGVPQGSVLGPILFNIYISPLLYLLDEYPDIHFHSYADDLQLYCNLHDPINNINTINKCINDISKWLSNNSLLLNSLKTKALLINTSPGHHSIPPIIINNHIIEYSNQAKNLGLTLDQKLSYLPHITNISKSINYTLHTIRLIRPSITTELAKLLVNSLILPRLDYCNSTLNSLPAHTIKMLTKLQYRAIRTIFRIKKYSRQHITPYMKSIHWLPIPYRIQYKLLLLTHHATHNNKPDYLTELLTNYKSSRPQRTIHKYKLNIPITLSLNKKQESSFSIISPKLWNSLPHSIRSIVSDHTFKVKLKTHIFNIAYNN